MHHRPPGNRNYGGVFIIFDKIGGTFEEEGSQSNYYGLSRPLETYNSILGNVEHFRRLFSTVDPFWSKLRRFLFGSRITHKFSLFPANLLKPHKDIWNCWDIATISVRSKLKSLN